jgi:hypothetical protein
MGPDPRWLDILKASVWQQLAVAGACGLFVWLVTVGVVPTDGKAVWIGLPAFVGLVCLGLALAAVVSTSARGLQPRVARWGGIYRERKAARRYIPCMTTKEREIIGYLLHHNQKVFQSTQDGGYAAPLISVGIVRMAVQPGQFVDPMRVPFGIADHIWAVLESNRRAFTYAPPPVGESEGHPWAIPWMAR